MASAINWVVTGDIQDDPTALTLALSSLFQKEGRGQKSTRKDIQESELRRAIGISHLAAGSTQRTYEILDAPWQGAWSKGLGRAFSVADIPVLVIGMDRGVTSTTTEYLRLLRCFTGSDRVLVMVNYNGEPPDEELLEVVRSEIESSTNSLFSLVDLFGGDPQKVADCNCINGECESCSPVRRLKDAMELVESPARDPRGSVRMTIEHVYERVTLGKQRTAHPVPFGLLSAGTLKVGDTIEVVGGEDAPQAARVESLQVFGTAQDSAESGQIISVLLSGIASRQVYPPRVLCQPGSCTMRSTLRIKIDGDQLQRALGRSEVLVTSAGEAPIRSLLPVTDELAEIELLWEINIEPGEGYGVVGSGQILASGYTDVV